MSAFWYILRTRTGFEETVAEKCRSATYVPKRAVRWFDRRKRRNRVRIEVAFPGYLFVGGPNYDSLQVPPDRLVFGVLRDADGSPLALSPLEFLRLKALEQELLYVEPEWRAEPGSSVRAVFEDTNLEGVVREIRGQALALDVPGSGVRVVVRKEALQAA